MKNLHSRRAAGGFTLIETLVALGIIALIASLVMMAYDGSRSKAQVLLVTMNEMSKASLRLQTDTGCISGMTEDLLSAPATRTCLNGTTLTGKTWRGPYMGKTELDGTGKIRLSNVSENVLLELRTAAVGTGNAYIVRATGVPEDILKAALRECNNADPTGAVSSATNACGGDIAGSWIEKVFSQTR